MNSHKFKKMIAQSVPLYLMEDPQVKRYIQHLKNRADLKNKSLKPYVDDAYTCGTCGSQENHPDTAYCFKCDTDNWIENGIKIKRQKRKTYDAWGEPTPSFYFSHTCPFCKKECPTNDSAVICCADSLEK